MHNNLNIQLAVILLISISSLLGCTEQEQTRLEGNWITCQECSSGPNQWVAFQKSFEASDEDTYVKIAADTKYWLWINDEMVIREGGLKWGASPQSAYQDEVTLDEFIREGKNTIKIALWHFGKEGFAHKTGPLPALRMDSNTPELATDSTWYSWPLDQFELQTIRPFPNWRLAEPNIQFNATAMSSNHQAIDPLFGAGLVEKYASNVDSDFQQITLTERPIPQWLDYGLNSYESELQFPFESSGDPITLSLPYNAQVTPYFKIRANDGDTIDIRTDNYRGGSEYNVRTTYICQQGLNTFETPGWMNGHNVIYTIPKGVEVLDLKFRETGYATKFKGSFVSNDSLLNTLWNKSARTLYITMRDNYMDCPDRERAQWWGDAVIQIGQTFYAFDRKSDLLSKKAIKELCDWQREDLTMYSPVPAGNWDKELPTQMLASVGYYGFWNYYMHSGDKALLKEIYPHVKKYLSVWQQDDQGLVVNRKGGWTWGDWGKNKDMDLIFNGWYYLALKGAALMAEELGHTEDMQLYQEKMEKNKQAWNTFYWNGAAYKSPNFEGDQADERGQALAVLADIASQDYYPALSQVLMEGKECSPYFEKYVLEALIKIGEMKKVQERMKHRYNTMIQSEVSTLWEGWQVGSSTWGGGTYNHSWSGGPLTLMSQYMAGVSPLNPGYDTILISPQLGSLDRIDTQVATPRGTLNVNIEKKEDGNIHVRHNQIKSVTIIVKEW